MFPTLSLGGLSIPTSGLIYIVGIWLLLIFVERSAKLAGRSADNYYNLAVVILVAGFVGARAIFVATYWSAFQENLTGIVWPLTSGFNLLGGAVAATAAGLLYGRSKRMELARTVDVLAPAAVVALIVIGLADLLAGPGYGTATDMPWGVVIWRVRRHPVQLYEIMVSFVALHLWLRTIRSDARSGTAAVIAGAVSSTGLLLFERYRANAAVVTGGYHVAQAVALIILLICLYSVLMLRADWPGKVRVGNSIAQRE